jgi:type III pantothenate kinase
MSLLAIDVGNTQTVIGVFSGSGELVRTWRIQTVHSRTSDELGLLVSALIRSGGLRVEEITGVAVSSSVPPLVPELRQMARDWFDREALVVGPGVRTGVAILYENPKEVGADRITNAVAAYEKYGGPAVVVDLGTATTFDAISERGEYLGGAIAPGVEISLEALYERAAALRKVEIGRPRRVIGKSTAESLVSGAVYGFAAQVDGMCALFKRELGDAAVIATGGLAHVVVPYCKEVKVVDPWLTLHGLRIIYARNQA